MQSTVNIKQAKILTYLGLAPFVIAVLIAASKFISIPESLGGAIVYSDFKARALVHSYGVVILSFLGGIQWGVALSASNKQHFYLMSNVLALMAWLSFMSFASKAGIVTLLFLFLMALVIDAKTRQKALLPAWFWKVRLHVSAYVMLSLILVFMFTY